MRKALRTISAFTAAAMLFSSFASTAVFAEERAGGEKRSIPVFYYGYQKFGTTECLFFEDEPHVAYIDPVQYLGNIFTVEFSEKKNPDGTYTVTKSTGETMTVDVNADTVYFEDYENFVFNDIDSEGTDLDCDYNIEHQQEIIGGKNGVTFELAPYNIDLVELDGMLYFPLPTLADIFAPTYNAGVCYDDRLYYVHMSDDLEYFNRSVMFRSLTRDEALIDYTYRELCFNFDHFYGQPSKSVISKSVAEKGFDKTLDEYNDDTRLAKQWLLSDQWVDFFSGMYMLQKYFDDGGHTVLYYEAAMVSGGYTTTDFAEEWNRLMYGDEPVETEQQKVVTGFNSKQNHDARMDMFFLYGVRGRAYEDYKIVQEWDNLDFCLEVDDTLVFVFDSFENEAVPHFKWALDYAKQKELKNFIIDDSCNGGGSTAVLAYMLAIMTNRERHSNVFELRYLCTLTGNVISNSNELDLNLDGVFDEWDSEVAYDFNFAVLTTKKSFSCGNILPVLAQDHGIPILGETSGGGACMLSIAYLPQSNYYAYSGCLKLMRDSGADVDLGAAVDYELTKRVYDENYQEEITDYSGLYDIEDVAKMVEAFYSAERLYGDTDGDGKITITDATLIQKYAIDLVSFSYWQRKLSEVDGDGKISIVDVTAIQRYLAEIEAPECIGKPA